MFTQWFRAWSGFRGGSGLGHELSWGVSLRGCRDGS